MGTGPSTLQLVNGAAHCTFAHWDGFRRSYLSLVFYETTWAHDEDGFMLEATAKQMIKTMDHRIFFSVDLDAWIYGTIEKHRQGASWQSAWVGTYREIGGVSKTTGKKACPMIGAKALFEFGRIKNSGLPFRDCEIPELWNRSRNGSYAILATSLLRANPHVTKTSLWREIQQAVRREVGEEPAGSNQGSATLAFKLWHLGLIVDGPA